MKLSFDPECWLEENIQPCCINKEGIYAEEL